LVDISPKVFDPVFFNSPWVVRKAGQTFKIGIYNFIIDGACFLWERKLNEGIEYLLEKKWLKPKKRMKISLGRFG